MRIFIFSLTLFLGVCSASFFKLSSLLAPCENSASHMRGFGNGSGSTISTNPFNNGNFETSRNYSKEEAIALVGKQIRNLSPLNARCPKESGNCLNLHLGELGEVTGILPSIQNTYLIEIQWNEGMEDNFQEHSGRFVTRAGKEISFEILK